MRMVSAKKMKAAAFAMKMSTARGTRNILKGARSVLSIEEPCILLQVEPTETKATRATRKEEESEERDEQEQEEQEQEEEVVVVTRMSIAACMCASV